MGFSANQVDQAFAALGLAPPGPGEVLAIESVNGPVELVETAQGYELPVLTPQAIIAELPEVQREVAPVVQMFDAALGYLPTPETLAAMVQSHLTQSQLATAIVSSQAFANENNGGVLLNPNAPASDNLVNELFIRDLGHPPTEATLAGFNGMTNAEAFLAFATSSAVTQTLATSVKVGILDAIILATGIVSIDPLPETSVAIIGQGSTIHPVGA